MRTTCCRQWVRGPGARRAGASWINSRTLALTLGLAPLLGGSGCGGSGIAAEVAAFKDSGYTVSAFTDTDPKGFGAKKCQTGLVDRLSVLLCEFPNSDAAAGGQAAAEAWGTETATVVVLRRGSTLFAVADRSNADPDGKNISALSKVFRRAKGR